MVVDFVVTVVVFVVVVVVIVDNMLVPDSATFRAQSLDDLRWECVKSDEARIVRASETLALSQLIQDAK